MVNSPFIIGKGRPLINLPKSQLIDIAHFAEGLFGKGLLSYEQISALTKTLNKHLKNKVFEHDGVQYRVMNVLSVGKDIKMRVVKMEEEPRS